MHRILIAAALLTALATRSPASAHGERSVNVQTGHSVVLDEPAVTRVAVGDRTIVSIRAVGDRQLLITGRAPGHTTAIVWTKGSRSEYQIEVTEDTAGRLAAMIQSAVPFAGVAVQAFDRAIVVRGSVDDPRQLAVLNDILGPLRQAGRRAQVRRRQRRDRRASARRACKTGSRRSRVRTCGSIPTARAV